MNLGSAIKLMQDNRFVARKEWPNLTYVFLRGEVFMLSSVGKDDTWTPTHRDLLRNDWREIIPER